MRDDEEGRYWVYFRYLGSRKLTVEVRRLTGAVRPVELDTRRKDHWGMATLFVEAMVQELVELGALDESVLKSAQQGRTRRAVGRSGYRVCALAFSG